MNSQTSVSPETYETITQLTKQISQGSERTLGDWKSFARNYNVVMDMLKDKTIILSQLPPCLVSWIRSHHDGKTPQKRG
jgi:hypothetical protein